MIASVKGYVSGIVSGDGLASRAKRGSLLTMVDFGGSNVLRLVSNLIMTRLLFPEAFGLMALVQVVTAGVQMFSDIGIGASLVRHERGDEQDFIDTAWTLQVIRGFCLWAAIAAVSPLAASFYDEPMLAQLLPVAGLAALIQGFSPTSTTTAGRHLMLGRVTALSIGNQVVNIAVTVALAWWLQSVWAIVFGILIGGLIRNLTVRLVMPGPMNRFRFEKAAAKEMISFGKFVMVGTLAGFIVQNADRAILGKFIDVDLLGVYVIAFTLSTVPLKMIEALTWRIMFPLYSRRPPHESVENRRKIDRARFGISSLIALGAFVIVLAGDPIIRFLYPDDFHAAGWMAILIAIGSLPSLILTSYNPVLLAANRAGQHAVLTMIHAIAKVGALYLLIREFGVVGAALAPLLSSLIHYPVLVAMIRPLRAWDPRHDGTFFGLSVLVVALAWHLNADLVAVVMAENL